MGALNTINICTLVFKSMLMNYFKSTILAVLILQAFSCKKENPVTTEDSTAYDTCFLTNVIEDGNQTLKLEYKSDTITTANGNSIEYNSNGFIKGCEFSRENMITYGSAGEIIYREEPTGGPAHTTVYYKNYYKYNSEGKLVQIIHHHWEDPNEIIGYDTFYYEKNNIIREEYYSGNLDSTKKLLSSSEYEYDDKINPAYTFDKLLGPANYNNVISSRSFWDGKLIVSYTSNFTYNASGYPIMEERTYMNGNKSIIRLEYSCR